MTSKSPSLSSTEALRQLYQELSAPESPYVKYPNSRKKIAVTLTDEAGEETVRTHLGKPADYVEFSRPPSPAVEPAVFVDSAGRKHRHVLEETTYGTLYTPQISSQPQAMTTEWALAFKVDCDLARKKTGSIDAALAEYAAADSMAPKNIAPEAGEPSRGKGGRPKKFTNADDLLVRYGKKTESGGDWDTEDPTTAWILENARELTDDASFAYDGYRDPVMAMRADGIEELAFLEQEFMVDNGQETDE